MMLSLMILNYISVNKILKITMYKFFGKMKRFKIKDNLILYNNLIIFLIRLYYKYTMNSSLLAILV